MEEKNIQFIIGIALSTAAAAVAAAQFNIFTIRMHSHKVFSLLQITLAFIVKMAKAFSTDCVCFFLSRKSTIDSVGEMERKMKSI